jgi:hypothetical protein
MYRIIKLKKWPSPNKGAVEPLRIIRGKADVVPML